MDWSVRSAGAVIAKRLDTSSEVSAYTFGDSKAGNVSLDTSEKPLGAAGSTRIAVLNADEANSGSLIVPFGTTYGNGDEFFVSFRIKASPEYCCQPWPLNSGNAGPKFAIVSNTSASNQPYEVVVQDNYGSNHIEGYWQDGVSSAVLIDTAASTNCSGSDFRQQPGIDNGASPLSGSDPDTGSAWSSCQQDRARYGPLYAAQSAGDWERGYGDPLSGGMRLCPDEWMTITVGITIGTFGSANSRLRYWAARENQDYVLIADKQNIQLGGSGPFNGVWLLPYVTERTTGGRQVSNQPSTIGGVTLRACGNGTPTGTGTLEYNATTGRFRWKGLGEGYGTARGYSAANGKTILNVQSDGSDSYVVLEVTNAGALPGSGTTEESITIAADRPDLHVNYADLIVSESMIPAPNPSALELLADSMSAGTWAELSCDNQDAVLGVGTSTGTMVPFCNSMPWNATDRCVEIVGADHNNSPRHVRYDEDTNSYVVVSSNLAAEGITIPMHGYDHNTINPYTDDVYHRLYSGFTGQIDVLRMANGGTSWSAIASVDALEQVAIGACWWTGTFTGGDGAGAQGCLVIYNSGNSTGASTDGEMVAYDPVAASWIFYSDSMSPNYGGSGSYHTIIEYSPIHNCAVYGGGNGQPNKVWRLNSDGSFDALTDVPTGKALGIQNGSLTVDPVTGNFLLLSADELWELDPTGSGTWTQQTGDRDPPAAVGDPGAPDSGFCCSIGDYGVVMYVTQNTSSGGNTYLYKPAVPEGGGGGLSMPVARHHYGMMSQ